VEELPHPDSDELKHLISGSAARAIYRILYEHRGHPITSAELRAAIGPQFGSQEQLGRRRRQLNLVFDIAVSNGAFELVGMKPHARTQDPPISIKTRAQVLQHQRCAMCGKAPLADGVRLVVDHKVPRNWGGGNEIENLQPLCEDCNAGKKDYFESFDSYADHIRQAIDHDEPHRRIGELLKAFDGEWVPGDLLSIVASAKQYQEDWQKRARELRTLGWIIETRKAYNEGARVRTYYRATHVEPWPDGPIASEIRRRERAKKTTTD
jgi:hypothetical protein